MSPAEIQDLRRRANLTQPDLGELTGVGKTVISLWENGHRKPTALQMVHLYRLRDSVERWEQKRDRETTWRLAAMGAVSAGLLSLSYFLDKRPPPND